MTLDIDIGLIEYNFVVLEWVATRFWCDFIVYN